VFFFFRKRFIIFNDPAQRSIICLRLNTPVPPTSTPDTAADVLAHTHCRSAAAACQRHRVSPHRIIYNNVISLLLLLLLLFRFHCRCNVTCTSYIIAVYVQRITIYCNALRSTFIVVIVYKWLRFFFLSYGDTTYRWRRIYYIYTHIHVNIISCIPRTCILPLSYYTIYIHNIILATL